MRHAGTQVEKGLIKLNGGGTRSCFAIIGESSQELRNNACAGTDRNGIGFQFQDMFMLPKKYANNTVDSAHLGYLPCTTYSVLLTMYYLPPTTYYLLCTTYYVLLTTGQVHSAHLGIEIKGSLRTALRDTTMWRIRLLGVWGYSDSNTPVMDGLRMADVKYGFFWSGIGPTSVTHKIHIQTVTISNSLIVGRSRSNPKCEEQV